MGAKEVFCLLYWGANGGQVDSSGKPIFQPGNRVGGLCPEPEDCRQCSLMQRELAFHNPQHVLWVCPDCIGTVIKEAKRRGISFRVPGHYTEGSCEYVHCERPPRTEDGEELGPGYSRMLQLFIGDINR